MKLFLEKFVQQRSIEVGMQRMIILTMIAGVDYVIGRLVMAFNTHGSTTYLCLGTAGLSAQPVEAVGMSGYITVVFSIVLGPLWEEYLFRMLLIRWLSKYVYLNVAVLLSALLFTFFHPQYWVDGIQLRELFSILISGIVYGYVYLSRRSFFDSFLVHALANSLILIPKESLTQYCDVLPNASILTIALALISLVALLILGIMKIDMQLPRTGI